MSHEQMLTIAQENQTLARMLADKQDDDFVLRPKLCTRIVNALLNSGNVLEQVVRDANPKETPHAPAADANAPGPPGV